MEREDEWLFHVFPSLTPLVKDSSARVYSSADLFGESDEVSYRYFHDGLVTFKSHRKNYLAVPVTQHYGEANHELQINIFAIGKDGAIEPVRNLILHEDMEDIPQDDDRARLFLGKLGEGCLRGWRDMLEEDAEEEDGEDGGGNGGEGEDDGGEEDIESDEHGEGREDEESDEHDSDSVSPSSASVPAIAEKYHIFYDVSAKDPADWSLCSEPPLVPTPAVPCSLSVDPTGEYSVSRNEDYDWSLKYRGEVSDKATFLGHLPNR